MRLALRFAERLLSTEIKVDMKTSDELIKERALWALGGGLIPIPIVDFVVVSNIQNNLIEELCTHFGVSYEPQRGKALISALVGTSLASMGASLIKMIPGVGSMLGGVSMSVMSGATTYALGRVIERHFEEGGTLADLQAHQFKAYYDEMLQEGKRYAQMMKDARDGKYEQEAISKEELERELQRLDKMRELGIVTSAQYKRMRDQLLDRYMG